jgi:hypothetical protein
MRFSSSTLRVNSGSSTVRPLSPQCSTSLRRRRKRRLRISANLLICWNLLFQYRFAEIVPILSGFARPTRLFLTLRPGWFGRGEILTVFYAAFRPLFSGAGRWPTGIGSAPLPFWGDYGCESFWFAQILIRFGSRRHYGDLLPRHRGTRCLLLRSFPQHEYQNR